MLDSQAQAGAETHAGGEPPRETLPDTKPAIDVDASLQALDDLDTKGLRALWRKLYRSNPPARTRRDLLVLAVGWKQQERAQGGPSGATRRRLANLSKTLEDDGDLARSRAVRLKPGAKLVREWHGETHTVIVTPDGFEWRGQAHGSLSVIAREITGTRWSGPRFFGLTAKSKPAGMKEGANG